jgi:hypothetical protein
LKSRLEDINEQERVYFQYFNAYTKREPYLTDVKTGLTESMIIQGRKVIKKEDVQILEDKEKEESL